MTKPTPTDRTTIEQQFADVDASFRLEVNRPGDPRRL